MKVLYFICRVMALTEFFKPRKKISITFAILAVRKI